MEKRNKRTAKRETKYCKHCHAEIDRHTNRCPFCGKKQRHLVPWIILIIIVAFIVLAIISAAISDTDETAEKSAETIISNVEETDEIDDYIHVGESFTVNGLEITFDSYDDDFTDYNNDYGWYTPDDGYKYVAATFTFKNVKSSGTAYISIYDFDCYADNALMEEVYVADTGDFINANLSPNRTKTFSVAFAVPINSESIELEYNTINYSKAEYIMKCK